MPQAAHQTKTRGLKSRKCHTGPPPHLLSEQQFGITPQRVSKLDSYDDQNFLLHMAH